MKLSAPKGLTLILAVILFVIGALAAFDVLSFLVNPWGIVLMIAGFVLLALGTLVKGL